MPTTMGLRDQRVTPPDTSLQLSEAEEQLLSRLAAYEQRAWLEVSNTDNAKPAVQRWARARAEFDAERRRHLGFGRVVDVTVTEEEARSVSLSETDQHHRRSDADARRQHRAAVQQHRITAERDVATFRRLFPQERLSGHYAHQAMTVQHLRAHERALCTVDGIAAPNCSPNSSAPRPRERRDGSRRHTTRGGTSDDPAPGPDSPEGTPPPPSNGRRFCGSPGIDVGEVVSWV